MSKTINESVVPTFVELVILYFQARHSVISEHSCEIREDTLKLYRQCRAWLPYPELLDEGLTGYQGEEIARFMEWENEDKNEAENVSEIEARIQAKKEAKK